MHVLMYLKCLLPSEEARAWDVLAEVLCKSSKNKTVFMYLFNICVGRGSFMSKSKDWVWDYSSHPWTWWQVLLTAGPRRQFPSSHPFTHTATAQDPGPSKSNKT